MLTNKLRLSICIDVIGKLIIITEGKMVEGFVMALKQIEDHHRCLCGKTLLPAHAAWGGSCGIVFFLTVAIIWCGFDRASSLICGNKMATRCNRGFYCRSYCLLNMFRAPLCPSSGAQECYTAVVACGIWCCGFQVVGLVWSWGLCVRFAGCWLQAASCKPNT